MNINIMMFAIRTVIIGVAVSAALMVSDAIEAQMQK